MDTACLTSLRILQPDAFENCSFTAKVLSCYLKTDARKLSETSSSIYYNRRENFLTF